MRQLLGEREGLTYETRHALPQGIVEAFDVIGFASFLRDGFVSLRWNHPCVSVILVRMKRGLFPVYQRDLGSECFGTVATPIADMKRNDLACLRIHGNPDPLPVGLLLHKTPHLIGLSF